MAWRAYALLLQRIATHHHQVNLWHLPSAQGSAACRCSRRGFAAGSVEKIIQGRFGGSALPGSGSYAGPQSAGGAGLGGGGALGGGFAPPSLGRTRAAKFFQVFLPLSGTACLVYAFTHPDSEPLVPTHLPPQLQYLAAQQAECQEVQVNWSGTHEARPKRFFQPQNEEEVAAFVSAAHRAKQTLRPLGSGLSPNGLGFSHQGGSLSMALMDKVVAVDPAKQQVTVQAGCRVAQLVEALVPHGLALQNIASIREQQIGGFMQVGAHGTGARIPPVDEQVVSMRMVTPGLGPITLSAQQEPDLFNMAKVGLGGLGVVTEVTLQCVPRHRLVERTFASTMSEVKKNHVRWLQENQHLRYMWFPYTDTVVVVQANPEGSPAGQAALAAAGNSGSKAASSPANNSSSPAAASGIWQTQEQEYSAGGADDAYRLAPMRELLSSKRKDASGQQAGGAAASASAWSGLSLTQLRDELLALDPLNKSWVSQVNKAEAECWRRSTGVRVAWSDSLLAFDCGGQQWVHEVCFPVTQDIDSLRPGSSSSTADLQYIEALLKEIKAQGIPAPCPIEQRWTSGSSASLSPSAGLPSSLHSWVGVIMYLPHDDQPARERVTQAFRQYTRMVEDKLMPRFNAAVHWAKLEVPPPTAAAAAGADGNSSGAGAAASAELQKLRSRLAARYPLHKYNLYREVLDPNNILGNDWLNAVCPHPSLSTSSSS